MTLDFARPIQHTYVVIDCFNGNAMQTKDMDVVAYYVDSGDAYAIRLTDMMLLSEPGDDWRPIPTKTAAELPTDDDADDES